MRQELFLPYFMEELSSKIERKKLILLIVLSLFIGFAVIGIGIFITPEGCELIGDDTAGLDSICVKCRDYPQPCSDEIGNYGAKIVVGLGLIIFSIPAWYPFFEEYQKRKIIENKVFE